MHSISEYSKDQQETLYLALLRSIVRQQGGQVNVNRFYLESEGNESLVIVKGQYGGLNVRLQTVLAGEVEPVKKKPLQKSKVAAFVVGSLAILAAPSVFLNPLTLELIMVHATAIATVGYVTLRGN